MSSVADENDYWRGNLVVCLLGSFSTAFGMTLLLPFLPVYVEQLGVHGSAAIAQWSGAAYAATFLSAGLVAPLWGHLGDRYGRKLMLIRASLGMSITMSLIGLCTNVWQLVGLRLLAGVAGGYASGASILVAAQTPRVRSAWALGVLSSGVMAGSLLGPLAGGLLPQVAGVRATFWGAGALIFLAFLGTTCFMQEPERVLSATRPALRHAWREIERKNVVATMLGTGMLLMFAIMSIEPIITLYVQTLTSNSSRVTFIAGVAMSATALGGLVSAPMLGRLADRIGHGAVVSRGLAIAALLLVPQAFVTTSWQLVVLRLLMGVALGGLMPCISTIVRFNVPARSIGAILGYSVSLQYAGQVAGPLMGGFVAGHLGMRAVFLSTSMLMLLGGLWAWRVVGVARQLGPAIGASGRAPPN